MQGLCFTGVGLCVGAAFLAAVAFVAIRFVPKTESSFSIALWFHIAGFVGSAIPLLVCVLQMQSVLQRSCPLWALAVRTRQAMPVSALQAGWPQGPVLPSPMDMAMMVAIATCSFSSHALIARAFLMDNAGKVSAAGYLQVCPVPGRNTVNILTPSHGVCLKRAIPCCRLYLLICMA